MGPKGSQRLPFQTTSRGQPSARSTAPRMANNRWSSPSSGSTARNSGLAVGATESIAAGAARTWFARRPTRLDALSATGGTMMIGLGATMLTVD